MKRRAKIILIVLAVLLTAPAVLAIDYLVIVAVWHNLTQPPQPMPPPP